MLFSFCVLFVAGSVIAATINVPDDEATIQDAIDAASSGDTILVAPGTYNEDLTIDESVVIYGSSVATINGVHTITADNVVVDGFTLDVGGSGTAITIDSSSSAVDNVVITNNLFQLTTSPSIGVYLGGGSPTYMVSDVIMNGNLFNGPPDMICNPWKIGGSFGSPLDTQVQDVDFEHNIVYRCSTPINLQDENIDDVLINGNIFRHTDGVVYVWGEGTPSGVLSNLVVTNNDIDSTNSYGVGIDLDGATVFDDDNFGPGNRIYNNRFVNVPGAYGFQAVSILSPLSSYSLDAENNWWGDTDPSDDVSSNVDYDPWYMDSALGVLNTVTDNLDVAVSSRADQESVDALATDIAGIEGKLDTPEDFKADVSNLDVLVSSRASQSSVDTLYDLLTDAGFGLEEIKNEVINIESNNANLDVPVSTRASQSDLEGLATQSSVDAIEVKLDDPTFGLEEIKNEVTTIESAALDEIHGLAALRSVLDDIITGIGNIISKLDTGLDAPVSSRASQDSVNVIDGKIDTLNTDVEAIESKAENLASQESVDAIETKADNIQNTLNDGVYGLEEIKIEVSAIEGKLPSDGIAAQDSIEGLINDVGAIEVKIDDAELENLPYLDTPVSTRADQASVEALSTDVGFLESKADVIQTDVGIIKDEVLSTSYGLAEIKSEVSNVEQKLPSYGIADQSTLVGVDSKVDALTTDVQAIETKAESLASQESVDAIETKADAIQGTLNDDVYGLAEIKSEVSNVEQKLPSDGIADQSTLLGVDTKVDVLESKADALSADVGVLESKAGCPFC